MHPWYLKCNQITVTLHFVIFFSCGSLLPRETAWRADACVSEQDQTHTLRLTCTDSLGLRAHDPPTQTSRIQMSFFIIRRHGVVLEGDYLIHSTLLFSSVASPLHQWSTLRADWLRGLRLPCCHWLDSGRCELWLVDAREGRQSITEFFSPAMQSVHMFEVNKPGVELSAAVL